MDNSKEGIITYIRNINQLDDVEKNKLIKRLEVEDSPVAVLSEIDGLLQEKIDGAFAEAGIGLDEDSLEYQAEYKKMMDGLQRAEDVFNNEMKEIEEESEQLHKETSNKIDDIKKEEIMATLGQKKE